ncbi:efflux RND transporter periplasmic adaptor subunit [Psychromonas sp. MME2]|uniref:efflux RND transporter periplasmic adaptor subunit n=1 Tax=unclassified Psychromonas TaxID=2614957 RepID=UPI00339C05BD
MKKYLLLTVIIALFLIGWTLINNQDGENKNKQTNTASPTHSVEVVRVDKQVLHEKVPLLGTVFAINSIEVKPESEGKIKSIHVKSGQMIEKGSVMVELDDRHQLAVVNREQARLVDYQRQYNNYRALFKTGAVTQATLESAETQWLIQQAELSLAKAALQDKTIVAPFSGKLGLVDLSRGQLVTPNTVLTTLDDASQLRLNVPIAARHINLLKEKQQVKISSTELTAEDKIAILSSIDSRVKNHNLNVYLQFNIDNSDMALTPGSLVTADILLNKPAELLIPLQSIVYQGHQRFVYRIANNIAEKVEVTLGERNGKKVQALTGLSPNDSIVYKGTVKLQDGAKVVIKS